MSLAADYLEMPQPALSRAISNLEKKIGKKLFDRIEGRLDPTIEADILYRRLAKAFETIGRINSQGWKSDTETTIKLAANPTFGSTFVPQLVASFLKSYPEVQFSIEVTTDSNVQRLVAEKHSDLGLRFAKSSVEQDLENLPIAKSRSVCILPPGHPLESATVLSPKLLSGYPQAITSGRFQSRTFIEKAFRDANAELNIVAECGSFVLVADFVLRKFGVAIINPFPITQAYSDQLTIRPFEPSFTRFSVISHRRMDTLSNIARTFVDFTRSQVVESMCTTTNFDHLQTFEDNMAL